MKNGTHDDEEPTRWTSIGWQTALILNRLKNRRALLELAEEKHEQGQRQTGRDRTQEEKAEDQRDYIETRLRELAMWERRISGEKKRKV